MQELTALNQLDKSDTQEHELTQIFQVYYKRVYNYIYYRVNCHYTTEDLTSQVFEKIIQKYHTYNKSRAPFEVWLFTIARNIVTDHFRSRRKYQLFSFDAVKELISKEKVPEEVVVKAETNDELLRALNILEARERHIVALKFGANLKNKEIAEMLRISESNVGVILFRTMKRLKKEVEREGIR
ncbi:sigma-70 family RNA polymerase sigma factor [Vallitalea okinawensis]|uniref:sigma-70 family RNA polymerase sigma factor n=1 Tax=Vallitalea okinawensis TaxID=2078660 RepID=UPI000CFCDB5E|nr:sigma-70 family RNA polymerase sigma factor [Vallitalea okinawensis]